MDTKLILRNLATLEHNLAFEEQTLINAIDRKIASHDLSEQVLDIVHGARRYAELSGAPIAHYASSETKLVNKMDRREAQISQAFDKLQIIRKRAELTRQLIQYTEQRDQRSEYKWSFRFFCRRFNFGFSKKQKFSAVEAITKYLTANETKKEHYLKEHMAALKNGELGKICKNWMSL